MDSGGAQVLLELGISHIEKTPSPNWRKEGESPVSSEGGTLLHLTFLHLQGTVYHEDIGLQDPQNDGFFLLVSPLHRAPRAACSSPGGVLSHCDLSCIQGLFSSFLAADGCGV